MATYDNCVHSTRSHRHTVTQKKISNRKTTVSEQTPSNDLRSNLLSSPTQADGCPLAGTGELLCEEHVTVKLGFG